MGDEPLVASGVPVPRGSTVLCAVVGLAFIIQAGVNLWIFNTVAPAAGVSVPLEARLMALWSGELAAVGCWTVVVGRVMARFDRFSGRRGVAD
jgi:hypothetical protein